MVNDMDNHTKSSLQELYEKYEIITMESYNRLISELNKDLMRLISEMRTEPLYRDYYKAKEAVLSIMTVEIEYHDTELIGYWRPKTLDEMGLEE